MSSDTDTCTHPAPHSLAEGDTWLKRYHQKAVHPDQLSALVADLRRQGQTIATINGSFDLLHAGHLHILHAASTYCDNLIVALNSDASIRQYKSPDRPIVDLDNRMQMIAALECVDYVTCFEELDPRKLLSTICPDVHINGAEYGKECIEAATVESGGGRIEIVDLVPGLSTSDLITKIQRLCDSSPR